MTNERLAAYLDQLRGNALADDLWIDNDDAVVARFLGTRLTSVFQTLHRLDDSAPVAAQALVRIPTGAHDTGLSPWNLFARAALPEQLVALDRRCRLVHALNFFGGAESQLDLYLCVHDRLLAAVADNHGQTFRRILDSLGIAHRRIVIELPSEASAGAARSSNVIAYYRLNGFRVAINPDGPAQLAAARSGTLPDVVKLDAPVWQTAWSDDRTIDLLAGFRDAGSEIVFKRVDSPEQLQQARRAGAVSAQGYLFSRPLPARDLVYQ